jgi:hypothetical protein
MTSNNLSRKLFRAFLEKNPTLTRVDNRNVCDDGMGNRYAFCISESHSEMQCRQFYEDCTDVIAFNTNNRQIFQVPKQKMVLMNSPNRITANGIRAYSAKFFPTNSVPSMFVL